MPTDKKTKQKTVPKKTTVKKTSSRKTTTKRVPAKNPRKRSTSSFKLTLNLDAEGKALIEKLCKWTKFVGIMNIISGAMYCKLNTVGGNLDMHSELYSFNGQSYPGYLNVSISDSANSVWEGLAFFIPSLPLKDTGHISAIFDGMNLTLPIKLVPTP